MKANELRIGNIIGFEWFGNLIPSCVMVFTHRDVDLELLEEPEDGLSNTQTDVYYKYTEPIPLTEEWLLKFGFVKDEEYLNRGAHCNYFTGLMRFKYCGSLGVWQFDVGTYEDLTMIKYVHQLQNLYFALTGEELEISDDKTKK